MLDKPPMQLIRELSIESKEAQASIRAKVESCERDIARVEAAHTKTVDALKEVEKKLAAVEERVNEVKHVLEELGRRRFTLFQGILCVALGGILAFLLQLAFTYIKSRLGADP